MVLQLCGRVCRRLSFKTPCFVRNGVFYSYFAYLVISNEGTLAQMVEQWTENPCVPGSIPGGTT
jgi:hypothetical protein